MKTNSRLKRQISQVVNLHQGPKNTAFLRRARVSAIIMLIAGTALLWYFGALAPWNKSTYLEFTVKPLSGPEKILEVCLLIHNPPPESNVFSLCKGETNPYDLYCADDQGQNLEMSETADSINIFTAGNKLVKLFYHVKIAQLGKHGYRGQYYENLLTFDGEETFLLPLAAVNGDEQAIKKSIGRITIKAILPADWVAVIPFAKKVKTNGLISDLKAPGWSKIYDLVKSAYTFGKLTKHPCPGEKLFSIYIDPEAQKFYTNDTLTGLKSIYGFYARLFGYKIPFSVVLLRKNPLTNEYLIGGSSTQTLATTFDPQNPRDWELMGHRFFHAFFDYKITSPKFHLPPQLWFYEGLATYYENMAMTSLPGDTRQKLGLDVSDSFLALFRRYLYMRLKDPALLAITPMSEEIINSAGQIEFLHYTQAPLIVKYMEDLSYLDSKNHDRALQFILHNNPEKINLQSVFTFALGKMTEFANSYLFQTEILPLWYLAQRQKEDPTLVIKELNDFEYTLWTWFRLENPNYMKDDLNMAGLAKQAEAEKAGLKFADAVVEAQVKQVSPTVSYLLKQYNLRTNK